MRILLFVALSIAFSAPAWSAESVVSPLGQNGLGETSNDGNCPCRFLSENKRLEGDLGIDDSGESGVSEGSAYSGG